MIASHERNVADAVNIPIDSLAPVTAYIESLATLGDLSVLSDLMEGTEAIQRTMDSTMAVAPPPALSDAPEAAPATAIAADMAEPGIADMKEVAEVPMHIPEPAPSYAGSTPVEIEATSGPWSEAPALPDEADASPNLVIVPHSAGTEVPIEVSTAATFVETANLAPSPIKVEAMDTMECDAPAVAHVERAASIAAAVVAEEDNLTAPQIPAALVDEPDVKPATPVSLDAAEMDTICMDEAAVLGATVANSEIAATAPSPTGTEETLPEGAAPALLHEKGTPQVEFSAAPPAEAPLTPDADPVPVITAAMVSSAPPAVVPASQVPAANPAYAMALKFAERGIGVFPLYGFDGNDCACGKLEGSPYCSPGKHPRQLASFKGASTSSATITSWFTHFGPVNYGIATGLQFGTKGKMLVAVDIDWYKPEARQSVEDLNQAGYTFPDTAEVLTGGGGRHLYYWAEVGTKFAKTAGPGIDIKGVGGYVVGPGSMHKSGTRYEFEASSDLFDGQEIADMPQWMYDKFAKPHATEASAAPMGASVTSCVDDLTDAEIASYKADLELIAPMERDTWVDVLMALKSRSESEQMFAVADWWSQKAGYEGVEAVRATWKSIKAQGGITIKTLKRLADAVRAEGVDISLLVADWSAPEPIHFGGEAVEYPLDALPELLKSAVVEAQAFAKAPVAMVASSAISTLSLAAQALYDVERAVGFTGPIGVFMLTVANSGERKTTLDGMFSAPIHEYEARCAMDAKTSIAEYSADFAAWEAKRKRILDSITRAAGSQNFSLANAVPHADVAPLNLHAPAARLIGGDLNPARVPVADTNAVLRAHELAQPLRPLVPRLIYADVTPEALKHNMAVEWPSAGIISSEGGAVLGGHGMKKDNQIGNMATLNEMWDGKPGRTDRKTTQAAVLKNARLTIAIQVQQPTLKAFVKGSGDLARGTGFLARYLVAWPASTMGTRAFTEPPATWPMRDRFHRRIADILNAPQPIVDRELKPHTLTLSKAAKAAWVAFHDEIEFQLGVTGTYRPVCDVGSKAADNAARVAALFHVLEGEPGAICEAHMIAATRVVRWHLNEAARLYGGLAVPPELEAAAKLNDWLVAHCKKEAVDAIGFTDLMRRAPNGMRKKADLEPPLEKLIALGRAKYGTAVTRTIRINPALLD